MSRPHWLGRQLVDHAQLALPPVPGNEPRPASAEHLPLLLRNTVPRGWRSAAAAGENAAAAADSC